MTNKIISKEDVEKVAKLARIEISEKENKKFAGELNSILDFFKNLSEVETEAAAEFDHFKLTKNQFREDEIDEASDDEKEAMRELFPDRKGGHLKVKEVLNNSH